MKILLTLVLFAFSTANESNNTRVKRSGITYVWPNGRIPYEYRPNFPTQDRNKFLEATRYIEARSCARFKPKSSEDRFWLKVVLGDCCSADMGRRPEMEGQGQQATFSAGLPLPFYLHELGHTLGFPHEQDRPDRDEYIYWDTNKEQNKCRNGFANKVSNLDQAAVDIPFDYLSLMADWTECYWPKPPTPKNIPMGPGGSDDRTFSVLDFEKINSMHDCKGCFGYRFTKISQLAWNTYPVEGGYELDKRTFYICRVYHEGHLLIGKSVPDQDKCWVGWENIETEYRENFSVLTNPGKTANLQWIYASGSDRRQWVKGGRTKDRETIYIGRCRQQVGDTDTLIPGYFLESNPSELRIAFAGGVVRCTKNRFMVLVCW